MNSPDRIPLIHYAGLLAQKPILAANTSPGWYADSFAETHASSHSSPMDESADYRTSALTVAHVCSGQNAFVGERLGIGRTRFASNRTVDQAIRQSGALFHLDKTDCVRCANWFNSALLTLDSRRHVIVKRDDIPDPHSWWRRMHRALGYLCPG